MDGETLLFRRTNPRPVPRLSLDEAMARPPHCGVAGGPEPQERGPLRGEGLDPMFIDTNVLVQARVPRRAGPRRRPDKLGPRLSGP